MRREGERREQEKGESRTKASSRLPAPIASVGAGPIVSAGAGQDRDNTPHGLFTAQSSTVSPFSPPPPTLPSFLSPSRPGSGIGAGRREAEGQGCLQAGRRGRAARRRKRGRKGGGVEFKRRVPPRRQEARLGTAPRHLKSSSLPHPWCGPLPPRDATTSPGLPAPLSRPGAGLSVLFPPG